MTEKESVLDTLSRITGVSREEQVVIFKQVVENRRKLSTCSGHCFAPIPAKNTTPRARAAEWACIRCAGVVSVSYVSAYRDGVAHTKGDVNSVTTIRW